MLELPYIYEKKTFRHRWNIRKLLYEEQRGHCYYCGRFMEKPVRIDMIPKDGLVKGSMCTVEHLDPKPLRMTLDPYVEKVVAACYACNQKMNSEFIKTPLAIMFSLATQLAEQQARTKIDVFPVPKGWLVPKPVKPSRPIQTGKSMKARIKKWELQNGRCSCCGEKMRHPLQNRSSRMKPDDPVRYDGKLVRDACLARINH